MSRSYTNVSIPNYYGTAHMLLSENDKLKRENENLRSQRDALVREMQNIMQAVKEWGYVDIEDESDRTKVRLVLATAESSK